MITFGKVVCLVLVLTFVCGAFPEVGLTQAPQITQAVTIRQTVVYKLDKNGNPVTVNQPPQGSTIPQGIRIGIYSFGHYIFGWNQGEFVKNDPVNQYIRLADLWVIPENVAKSDPRPCQVVDTTQLPLGEGDTAKVEWYKSVTNYTPLFAVGTIGTAVANPAALAALAVNPEAVVIGVVIVGGVVLYKIYEKPIQNAINFCKATLFVLGSQIAAATIVIPQALPGIPDTPDHIKNHPRGDIQSAVKTAVWITIWNAVLNGKRPDWCGKREDGSIVVVFYNLVVTKITGGLYKGLAIIFNYQAGNTTTLYRVDKGQDSPRGNEFLPFIKISEPCNPWSLLLPAS